MKTNKDNVRIASAESVNINVRNLSIVVRTELQLVKYSRFPRGIQSNHQHPHFSLATKQPRSFNKIFN